MWISRVSLVVSIITLSALSSTVFSASCQSGYFLAYRNPSISGDTETYCQECECGGNYCQDYTGCSVCPMYYFKLRKDSSYPSRSFNRCVKCNNCYLGSYCVDQTGCTRCESGYSQITKMFPGSGNTYKDCQYNGGRSSSTPVDIGKIFFIIIVIVVIFACISRCAKANRTIYTSNGAYNQQPSISYSQPVMATPIYTQPVPVYTQPPPPVYAQQSNPVFA